MPFERMLSGLRPMVRATTKISCFSMNVKEALIKSERDRPRRVPNRGQAGSPPTPTATTTPRPTQRGGSNHPIRWSTGQSPVPERDARTEQLGRLKPRRPCRFRQPRAGDLTACRACIQLPAPASVPAPNSGCSHELGRRSRAIRGAARRGRSPSSRPFWRLRCNRWWNRAGTTIDTDLEWSHSN